MKCVKCGYDDNGTGDTAHVCGPVEYKRVMPKRIKELAAQAKLHMVSEPRLEEFAMLVMQECAKTILSNYDRYRKEYFAALVLQTFDGVDDDGT